MKKLITKSKQLLFVLAALVMGAGTVWADATTETFDDGNLPDGWAIDNTINNNSYRYITLNQNSTYSTYSRSGDYCLYVNSSANPRNRVVLPIVQGDISIWYRATSSDTNGTLAVYKYKNNTKGDQIGSTLTSKSVSYQEWTATLDEETQIIIELAAGCIDDITITYPKNPQPKALAVANTTYNSATLTWTAGGDETDWQVAYGTTADFDADAATKYDVNTTPSYEITNLTAATTYYACVRAIIGEEYSSWTNKVSFTTPVQFPAPTAFALTGFTATTATFGWTAGSTETAWEISYSENSAFEAADGTKVSVTTNPFTLDGLTAETTYYAYIRANYGSDYSDWSEKISFTPSNTMNLTINEGTTTNSYIPVYGNWVDNVNYNKSQFIIPSTSISSHNGRAITKMTFYTSNTSAVTWSGNIFDVYMKETDATTVATSIDCTGTKVFTGSLSVKADGTMDVEIDEGFLYGGQNLLIGFDMTKSGTYSNVYFYGVNEGSSMYTSNGTGNSSTFLPKITISSIPYVAPSVKKPSDFTASEITASSAKLSWTDGEEGLTAWQIAYSTDADFDPATSGTKVDADANPYTLTGLTAETTYYAYVRAKKGTDYSDWSNKVEFMPTANIDLTVNDGTQTNNYVPVYGNYVDNYDKVEFIIPASSIDEIDGGTIKGLTFYLSSPASASWGSANFKVYMKEVDETTISAFNFSDDDVALYNGPLDGTQATMKVTFTTPYTYSGGNLLIGFYNTAKGSYKAASFYGVTAESGASVYGNNSSSLASVTTPNKQSFLPKTTFTYLPGTPKAKMVVTPTTIDFGTLSSASESDAFTQTFTISNTSKKVDLTSLAVTCTSEGYSASALPRTTITTEGENAEAIELTVTFAPTEDKTYDGTITVTGSDDNEATITLTGVYSNIAATMAVTDADDVDVNGTTIDFGAKGKSITKTYTVTNDGDLTLNASIASNNADFFTVSPADLTVAGHSSETFDVTFVWANSDLDTEKTATITLTAGELSQSFTVKGTRIEQWSEEFDDDPTGDRGWIATAATNSSYGWSFDEGKAKCRYYDAKSYLTTPKLYVSGSTDVLTFDYESTGAYYIYVEISKDGGDFASFKTIPDDGYLSSGTTGTCTITGLEEGIYQFRFKEHSYNLDNFEGFKLYVSEHDATITAQSIPTSGYQNQAYTATVTVKEMANKAETGVVAKLYIDDEEKATDTQNLTAGGEATFTLTFTPTEAFTGTAKIEVTYEDVTLNSATATVTIKAVDEYDETENNEIATGYSKNVLLKRTFIKGWNTVCLPVTISYPRTIESVFGTGVKAYTFDSYSAENGLGFKVVTNKEMAAATPYLLFIPETVDVDALSELFFETVSVNNTSAGSVEKGSDQTVTFQGTYSPIAAGSLTDNYVLTNAGANAKIAKATEKASMKAFRAYFTAPAEARMTISFDDNTTGIGAITTDGELEVGTLYNLKGQKVQGTQKGLYILNGKKVVVK